MAQRFSRQHALIGVVALVLGTIVSVVNTAGALTPPTLTARTAPLAGLSPAAANDPQVWLSGGVSCPDSNTCVAVGNYTDINGHQQGLLEVKSGGAWTARTVPLAGLNPAPAADPQVSLSHVDCPTATFCAVLGGYIAMDGGRWPMLLTTAGDTWIATTVPIAGLNPAAATPTASFVPLLISDLDCPAAGWCRAVGSYFGGSSETSGTRPIVITFSGGSWAASSPAMTGVDPAPLTRNPYGALSAVSCVSIDACVAVGSYQDTSLHTQGLIETYAAGAWVASTVPLTDLNPAAAANPIVQFHDVDCATATMCAAVGVYGDADSVSSPVPNQTVQTPDQGLIATLTGGAWHATTTPTGNLSPQPKTNPPSVAMNAVDCPAADWCVAVGRYATVDTASYAGIVAAFDSDTWTASTIPLGGLSPAAGSRENAQLRSLQCLALQSCIAAGGYADVNSVDSGAGFNFINQPLLEALDGTTWTPTRPSLAGLSPAAQADQAEILWGISCSSDTNCTAVSSYTATSGQRLGMILEPPAGPPTPGGGGSPGPGPTPPPAAGGGAAPVTCASAGYSVITADGAVHNFGVDRGTFGPKALTAPIVGGAPTPTGRGAWLVARDGGVFTTGDATFFGSFGGQHLNAPIVGIIPTQSGRGYWLVASDGGVFSFGDATFLGSTGDIRLNAPVVAAVTTPDGKGYSLIAADGGTFNYGTARFLGSLAGMHLNAPIVSGILNGTGLWLVAADGGVFTLGTASFLGSMGNTTLNAPIIGASGMAGGYRLVGADGGVFNFGLPFCGVDLIPAVAVL